jgi:Urate oxidase N-terminal
MSAVLAVANIFSKDGIHWILQWWHVVFGVAWIGLLYYFNFVQVPSFPTMEAAHRNGAIDKLVPRALWYFRWAAAATAITGLAMLGLYADAIYKGGTGHIIYAGSLFGLVMLANVWLVIWPNQQTVIANARGLLEGKPANPAAAGAGRKALLASRTNAIFSIPMLMCMTGAQGWLGANYDTTKTGLIWWALVLIVIIVLELNALGFIGGMEGPLTKPLAQHKNVAHIGVPVAIVLALAWMVLCT